MGDQGSIPPRGTERQAAGGAHGGFIPVSAIGSAPARPDLAAIRERLRGARGRQYWRSLEELAETEEFQEYLQREFPLQAPREMTPLSRREFFRVMGATLALAGVGGCAYQPPEEIVPYVEQPEKLIPGKPLFFATADPRGGYAHGVLAESTMGRPTKLEGNPDHPASLGATDALTQASLLGLYDPDRSQAVRYLRDFTTWDVFLARMTDLAQTLRQTRGAGLRVVTETITSPTLADQLRRFLSVYPEAKLYQHEPVSRQSAREAAIQAFGEEVQPVYHLDRAEILVALDANFLVEEPGSVRYARDFSEGRRVRQDRPRMNRLYVIESTPSLTGACADHRWTLPPSRIEAAARAIAAAVGVPGLAREEVPPPAGVPGDALAALARDLQSHRGACLVIPGICQSPAVHLLAHAINDALGNIGRTVTFTEPVEVHFGDREGTLRELVDEMNAGRVETLVILSSNPVYTAPADLSFRDAMQKVRLRIHLGLYDDETGAQCQWHVPESHYLETWSDARAYDGTVSIIQPLIKPLYATHSAHELIEVLLGQGDVYGYDAVRAYWRRRWPGAGFEKRWHEALVSGVVASTRAPEKVVSLRRSIGDALSQAVPPALQQGAMEIVFRPDPTVWDGRFANNGWLQELPKPLTHLTWDNAALISPETAEARGLEDGDLVDLSFQGRTLRAAVWKLPGQPNDVVTLTLGYGRSRAGRIGSDTGFNAYALRTSDALWFGAGLQLEPARGRYQLVSAQTHFQMKGRHLARAGTLQQFAANPRDPGFVHVHEDETPRHSLYDPPHRAPEWPSDARYEENGKPPGAGVGTYEGTGYNNLPIPAWGMVIDLNACIGCGACVLACQAENNIATVGKDQVARHREMHWIRIDTWYQGDPADPHETLFQPVPCMQCEKAPCEPVCPVAATTHSAEGLNEQTYNRCVGTRYCQNNCPWKVRRFNYLQYTDQNTPSIKLLYNPDVTVRSRGVMEKCTYCVQRINEGRIQAEKEERAIRDGDILTACQQVCPTQAIVFGNINDAESHNGRGSLVRQLKQESLNYINLAELNTRPRTSYLAKVWNPNPELAPAAPTPEGH